MSGFPGLQTGIDGDAYLDPHNLKATMDDVREGGASLLVVLTEENELPEGAFAFLQSGAEAAGLELHFIPIPDYAAPDNAALENWHALCQARNDLPNTGGTVAFCCQHGAGRSGTMAAYVLMQLGIAMDQAITTVRDGFDEAIESENQLKFLQKISAGLKRD